jgi:hypothetical protein
MCIFILARPLVFCNKLFSIKEAFKDLCWYMLWRSLNRIYESIFFERDKFIFTYSNHMGSFLLFKCGYA